MTFTFVDVVFAVVVLCFAVSAAVHGFIRELFGKLAVVAGVVAGFYFCGMLAPYFSRIIPVSAVDIVLSFVLIFVAAFLFVKILQILIGGIFSGEILKSLDRVLGFAFGALEGLLIVVCVLILLKAQVWFDIGFLTERSAFSTFLSPFLEKPVAYIQGMFV